MNGLLAPFNGHGSVGMMCVVNWYFTDNSSIVFPVNLGPNLASEFAPFYAPVYIEPTHYPYYYHL